MINSLEHIVYIFESKCQEIFRESFVILLFDI